MKLKQKTLFQCFEKTPSKTKEKCTEQPTQPTVAVAENPSDKTSRPVQTDILRPIHIRQLNDPTLSFNDIPSFPTRRHIPDPHSSVSLSTGKEFFRICPQISAIAGGCPSTRLKCRSIDSCERQMSLFADYTMTQSFIDWRSMFDHFQEYRRKALEQNQYEQLLWTDLYRPKSTTAYLGNHTRQVQRLHQWFAHWANKLQNEQSKKTESKKRKRPLNDDGDGDDASEYSRETFQEDSNLSFASSFQQKSEHPQLIFVHGSGTTSLVHALAEEFNFKVTEINGSQSRARTPLLKQLEQVTSHHQLAFKRCPSDTVVSQDQSPLPARKRVKNERSSIKSFFKDEGKENRCEDSSPPPPVSTKRRTSVKKRRSKVKIEEAPIRVLDNSIFSSVHVEKTSLILFDEIETLTTDENFWSSLKKLLVTARKPIILTSNSRTNPEEAIMNLSKLGHYELIHLEVHDFDTVETFLRLILLSEMIEISSNSQPIRQLIESSSGDIRQILNTLQYSIQSSNGSDEALVKETYSNLSDHLLQTSSMFDAMFYSRLNEQCLSSSLKSFFDPLTQSYLDQYDRSNEFFRGKCPNPYELCDTFKLFMQEQHISYIKDQPSFYLDYRPFVRQICQNEHKRAEDSNPVKRLRHALAFRGCSLQWSDFQILSTGLDPRH